MILKKAACCAGLLFAAASPAFAQQPPPTTAAPDRLVLYFDNASVAIRPQDQAVLNQAARLYRDGKPVLMTLTGQADNVGSASGNFQISSRRALAVLYQLVARGIPAERFELVAKGATEEPISDPPGTPVPGNRRVEIRWR